MQQGGHDRVAAIQSDPYSRAHDAARSSHGDALGPAGDGAGLSSVATMRAQRATIPVLAATSSMLTIAAFVHPEELP